MERGSNGDVVVSWGQAGEAVIGHQLEDYPQEVPDRGDAIKGASNVAALLGGWVPHAEPTGNRIRP